MPSNVFWGMQHINANILAAVTVDLSGPDPINDQLLEVCVLPLDRMLDPHSELLMFCMKMKPEDPQHINWAECRMSRSEVADAVLRAYPREKVADILVEWFHNLDLNNRKKIIPLGYNYAKTRQVLINWLGWEVYEEIFAEDYRDVLVAAHFINDRDCVRMEPVTFSKQNLRWLANQYHIPVIKHGGSCAADAMTIGQVYKRML